MATLATSSPHHSPSRRRGKGFARRCERFCWKCITCFPLVFVYCLTTWAVWVQASVGFTSLKNSWIGMPSTDRDSHWVSLILLTSRTYFSLHRHSILAPSQYLIYSRRVHRSWIAANNEKWLCYFTNPRVCAELHHCEVNGRTSLL